MTKDKLVTVREGVSRDEAKRLLHQHRIEKIIVVDDAYRCVGLITVKDIEKAQRYPNACKDERGRLRVAAATGVGDDGFARAMALVEAGSTWSWSTPRTAIRRGDRDGQAHPPAVELHPGDRRQRRHRRRRPGADRRRRRRGQGRHRPGLDLHHAHRRRRRRAAADRDHGRGRRHARKAGVPVIADGGIKYSGDLAKAIAAGARLRDGGLAAGRHRGKPGRSVPLSGPHLQGLSRHGLGRRDGARLRRPLLPGGSAATLKLVPEGVEGQVPYKGPVGNVVHQIIGGLRAAMGYTGCRTIAEMQKNASSCASPAPACAKATSTTS